MEMMDDGYVTENGWLTSDCKSDYGVRKERKKVDGGFDEDDDNINNNYGDDDDDGDDNDVLVTMVI